MWHRPYSRFLAAEISLRCIITALALACLLPSWARGDEALPPVVITALGEASAADDVPGVVLQLDENAIASTGADHPAQLLNQLPGFNIHRNSGQEHLTAIRSPVLTGGAGAGSFLFLEDGVALRAPGFANVNGLMDAIPELASAVEAVAGPGTALYGSNAVHGLVHFISRAPNTSEGRGRASLKTGAHGLVQFTGWLDGEVFAGGLVAAHDDGWRDASGFDHYKTQWRFHQRKGAVALNGMLAATRLQQETAAYAGDYQDDALREENPEPDAYRDSDLVRGQIGLNWQQNTENLWELKSYFRAADMNFLMHFIPSNPTETNHHDSIGLQLRHHWQPVGGHRVVSGLEGEWTKGSLLEVQDEPAPPFLPPPVRDSLPQGVHYDYRVAAASWALFSQWLWRLGERIDIHAGLRAEQVFYDYNNRNENGIVGRYYRPPDRRDDFFALTPKLGFTGHFEGGRFFINLATAARAPQTSDLYRLQEHQIAGEFKSERLTSVEIGWESQGEIYQLRLAAYHMAKRNFHFRDADRYNVANGRTRHNGIEAGLALALNRNWSLSIDGEYAEHRYDFSHQVDRQADSEAIKDGDFIDSAPKRIARTELAYERQGWRAALIWQHMGDYYTDAANNHSYPGHDLFHLHLSFDVAQNMTLRLHGLNLTDKAYAERADYGFGNARYFPGEGRTARLALSAAF